MKLDPSKKDWDQEWSWVGHPDGKEYGDKNSLQNKLIARRYDIEIIGGIEDEEASYSYDDWSLCELDGEYYLLSTSGCSCPSPTETWGIQHGPATLSEIRNHLQNGNYEGYTVPGRQMQQFLDLIDKAEGKK